MIKPNEQDFDIKADSGQIVATFKPTDSHYTFVRLEKSEWPKHGKLSHSPHVQHTKSGDTGSYDADTVCEMAYALALKHS